MRQAMLATALLVLFGAHIIPPKNFTPLPIAHGIRECGRDEACVKNCRHDRNCENQCRTGCR
jgi:hypothetical protein